MRRQEPSQQEIAATAFIRRRRFTRVASIVSIVLLAATSIAAHHFHPAANDFSRFNHRQFIVTDALAGDLIRVQTDQGDVTVQFLAIAAPRGEEHWSDHARTYTANRLVGKRVALLLDPPQTRDAAGNLLAYVYPFDIDNMSVDIVKDGMAYVDHRVTTLMTPPISLVEAEARKKSRGLWKGLRDDGMPAWRRDWLAQRRTSKSTSAH
jgi:endonuclease YncB( thermonuclease family)